MLGFRQYRDNSSVGVSTVPCGGTDNVMRCFDKKSYCSYPLLTDSAIVSSAGWLVRRGYKVPVTEVLTGCYAWSAKAVKAWRPHLETTDFRIEMEMVTKMARLGLTICSVPISYNARLGTSSLNPVKDGLRIMGEYMSNLHWRSGKSSKS